MPTGALIAGGLGLAGSIGGSLIGSNAATNASNAQMGLGQQALAQQTTLGQQGLATLLKMFQTAQTGIQPVLDAGGNVLQQGQGVVNSILPTLKSLLTPGPNMTSTLSQIPGFQFAQDWGQKAVQNLGTTTGLGGNVLKAGADYATGVAQQGFGGLVQQLQALLNSGSGLISTGAGTLASGANALAGAATGAGSSAFSGLNSLGSTIGNTLTGIGNSTASGILGSANALTSGLTGGANSITNSLLLSKLFNGAATGVTPEGGIYGAVGPTSVGGAPLVG